MTVQNLLIRAKDLSKWYGTVSGIIELNLELPPGVIGLLGPNGAGKSTFLKMVTGLAKPSRGTLEVLGQRPWNNPGLYSQLGYCPEEDAYYPWMTGRRYVETMARLAGATASQSRKLAQRSLEQVQLTEQADKLISAYSKGMKQRLKIAQALVHTPRLLVLDEPLNGLDPLGRRLVIELVQQLGERGISVLVSSHVLHEVEAMTRTILLIHQGRLLASGDISELRDLIDDHPQRISIQCSEPRKLAAKFLEEKSIRSFQINDEAQTLLVESLQPDLFYSALPKMVLEEGIQVEELSSPDNNLDAVFRYLVKR